MNKENINYIIRHRDHWTGPCLPGILITERTVTNNNGWFILSPHKKALQDKQLWPPKLSVSFIKSLLDGSTIMLRKVCSRHATAYLQGTPGSGVWMVNFCQKYWCKLGHLKGRGKNIDVNIEYHPRNGTDIFRKEKCF